MIWPRRSVLRWLALAPIAACAAGSRGAPEQRAGSRAAALRADDPPGDRKTQRGPMQTRAIPSSGAPLPVVGLGTWQTFDVGADEAERAPLREVLRRFFDGGGRAIDSSPMYGRAEAVVGDLLRGTPHADAAFLATKVWTTGKPEGEAQIAESERRMGGRLDLVEVHNLVDWRTQLATLRSLKDAGRIRYVGVTHWSRGAFDEIEQILSTEALDFVQLPYSAATREAEHRLLPLARERGVAVLVMRPFEQGELFRRSRGVPLPAAAAELGAASWAEVFLRFILAHPAVTAVIPATSNPEHVSQNLAAGAGPFPDERQKREILAALGL
ncbi:MAG TPA: aldo/keto reductase [Anaeromyxobacteraceae bacterium]|nr:aldo/keto reductase [Anaeromyxobacteraceae bacterium]